MRTCGIDMIPYYYLYEAKRRLVSIKQTIAMLGGEDDCQPMLLGQRDMLKLEVEYYRQQSAKFTIFLLTLIVFCVSLYYLFITGVFNV
jgi:hypothetical protein